MALPSWFGVRWARRLQRRPSTEALAFFLKFYREHALEHTKLYEGVREAVEALAAQGHTMAVLTNKPVRISTDIVAALGLSRQFPKVYGGDSFPVKKPDPIGINTLREETRTGHSDTLMIGDSAVDIETARNAGVLSCGVAWGFQPEGFAATPPDFLVTKPQELVEVAGSKSSRSLETQGSSKAT